MVGAPSSACSERAVSAAHARSASDKSRYEAISIQHDRVTALLAERRHELLSKGGRRGRVVDAHAIVLIVDDAGFELRRSYGLACPTTRSTTSHTWSTLNGLVKIGQRVLSKNSRAQSVKTPPVMNTKRDASAGFVRDALR